MDKIVKERIKEFLEYLNIGQNAFEAKVGWSNGYINNTKNISADKLKSVANEYPQLSLEWLITGNGEMIKREVDIDYKEKYYNLLEEQNETHSELNSLNARHIDIMNELHDAKIQNLELMKEIEQLKSNKRHAIDPALSSYPPQRDVDIVTKK